MFIPALLLASGSDRGRQLPHVPGRGRRSKPDGTVPCSPRSCPAARRRPRTAPSSHQQPEEPITPRSRRSKASAQSSARLPRLRQGRRVSAAGFQLQLRLRPQPDDRREEHAAEQAVHRRTTSRCSPTAASCARAACASPARSAARRSCMIINRGNHSEIDIFPGRAAQQQAGQQRRRSVPGRRPVQQGFPVQAARLVPEDERAASAPIARPAAASTSTATRTSSIACGRGTTRRPRATSCATTAGSAITTSIRSSASRPMARREG